MPAVLDRNPTRSDLPGGCRRLSQYPKAPAESASCGVCPSARPGQRRKCPWTAGSRSRDLEGHHDAARIPRPPRERQSVRTDRRLGVPRRHRVRLTRRRRSGSTAVAATDCRPDRSRPNWWVRTSRVAAAKAVHLVAHVGPQVREVRVRIAPGWRPASPPPNSGW